MGNAVLECKNIESIRSSDGFGKGVTLNNNPDARCGSLKAEYIIEMILHEGMKKALMNINTNTRRNVSKQTCPFRLRMSLLKNPTGLQMNQFIVLMPRYTTMSCT